MDFTLGVALRFSLISTLFAGENVVNSSLMSRSQDVFNTIETDLEELDTVSRIMKINKHLVKHLIGGDINLDRTRTAQMCQGNDEGCLWTTSKNGNIYIPYNFKAGFNKIHQNIITSALMQFNILTCIKFKRRTNEREYIQFVNGNGCWSFIGPRNGKPQEISLSTSGCVHVGVIHHEIMHALGFQHEHTRSDRDKYIDIIMDHIKPGSYSNFKTKNSNNLGTPYDYGSIMHYGKYIFSKGFGYPTILPKPNRTVPIGQIKGFSSIDLLKINRLYKCKICGTLFTKGAGGFTSPDFPDFHLGYSSCNWIIRAPKDQKILLQFDYFHIQKSLGCIRSHVGIYDGATTDSPIIQKRVCGRVAPAVISNTPMLLFIFFANNIKEHMGFSAKYQFVRCGRMLPASEVKNNGKIEYKGSQEIEEESNCFWLVQTHKSYKVILHITTYNFQTSPKCTKNYLEIHDVSKAPPENKGKFCASKPAPLAEGSALLIEFKHQGGKKQPGFKADFKTAYWPIHQRDESSLHWSHCNTFMLIFCILLSSLRTLSFL
ncbi:astacin-like metalloendopeptidase isoform X2 [Scyliorhinus canicula]|nr:astacin-like metalloendopeptidase isoform X2 [Scyliorhinus canicula]